MKNNLQAVLHADCFLPNIDNYSITLTENHKLACDGITAKDWTQELKITDLAGDEIFLSFDWENHKTYSPYLIGDENTLTAKACDYIMLKKEGERWNILLGELKMGTGSFSGESIKKQIDGSFAFLKYVMQIIKHQFNCSELIEAHLTQVVVYRKKIQKSAAMNRRLPIGRVVKRSVSPVSNIPDIGTFDSPYNDIIKIGLPFNDGSRKSQSLTLNQFMGRSN